MVSTQIQSRDDDRRTSPILRGLCFSLVFHFIVFAVIELGFGFKLWNHSILRSRALDEVRLENLKKKSSQPVKPEEKDLEIPLMFVEVDPSQAAKEPPKDAKFYSDANTLAANPDPKLGSDIPKIEGKQDNVPKTFDTPKPEPQPLQPSPPQQQEPPAKPEPKPADPVPEPKPAAPVAESKPVPAPPEKKQPVLAEQKPQESVEKGDLNLGKPNENKPKDGPTQKEPPREVVVNNSPTQPPPHVRPRTLAQARAQRGIIEGEKMRQDGGVPRHSIQPSLDVRSSPFGAYDAAFIAAVQARWDTLLRDRDFVRNQAGRVVIDFKLGKDGRILDMKVAENEVNDTLSWLCQRAIRDPAPYAPFPSDLRRLLAADYRDVRFTFYYHN